MSQTKAPKPIFLPHGPKAVLLLHAYSGSPNDVRMLSRALEKLDYTVYAPMYAGHGTSDPLDILNQGPEIWWEETQQAAAFLREKGYEQIAVFGLSMGGVFATRLLTEQETGIIGGGFFCSPISPVKTTVVESFLLYAKQVLEQSEAAEVEERVASYRSLVQEQLDQIQEQAGLAYQKLLDLQQPYFMAQAAKDRMIDPAGVFMTAERLKNTRFQLNWYPKSGHVITVGPERRQLEQDVADFLASLDWRE
ncbi:alpha/beta fold hydrolase [Enterococcus sp. 669A]|uniref:Alpha/beta fold hydrolase n=1 Tax=Candidatus Enterococcus moelleringii TaxID=2815325 RepID=A0ABS3LCW9_9ENTE|nr:alpha/beta fold hydrolase [Enterococcus sp. 669A]MBO1307481.1 alpha/beta fold hydrolase [Enterococcus sp. 669A]